MNFDCGESIAGNFMARPVTCRFLVLAATSGYEVMPDKW